MVLFVVTCHNLRVLIGVNPALTSALCRYNSHGFEATIYPESAFRAHRWEAETECPDEASTVDRGKSNSHDMIVTIVAVSVVLKPEKRRPKISPEMCRCQHLIELTLDDEPLFKCQSFSS